MRKIFLLAAPLLILIFAFGPNKHTVTGSIKDENGQAVVGASIIEKELKTEPHLMELVRITL